MGKKKVPDSPIGDSPTQPLAEKVKDCLYQVVDPEIALNIVDMGLVYGVEVQDDTAILDLTLTTPACPLTAMIDAQVRDVLLGVVKDVRINWVWDPIWDLSKITDSGREQLRAIGFNL
jgi:metal-sulfur cluster biosynthetic enzyme